MNAVVSSYPNPMISVDDISRTIGRTPNSIQHLARKLSLSRMRRCNVSNELCFSMRTPETAYWAGFLMADGCVEQEPDGGWRVSLELSSIDEAHLSSFAQFVGCNNPIGHRPDGRYGMSRIRFRSSRMANDLEWWGVIPRKTHLGNIPEHIDDGLLPHYFRGLFDGDGNIYSRKRGNRISHTMSLAGNIDVIHTVDANLRSVRIPSNAYIHDTNQDTGFETWILVINGIGAVRNLVLWMHYDDADAPALPRKRERAMKMINDPPPHRLAPRELESATTCPLGWPPSASSGGSPATRCCSGSRAAGTDSLRPCPGASDRGSA